MFDLSLSSTKSRTEEKLCKEKLWYKRPIVIVYALLFLGFNGVIFNWSEGVWNLLSQFGFFFFLGLVGAFVANSTGAGGGVIFIPFFYYLGFSEIQSVATSMAIQCFGMTAGAVSWLSHLSTKSDSINEDSLFIKRLLCITGFSSIIGMLLGQYFIVIPGLTVEPIFQAFSICFGVVLFFFTLAKKNYSRNDRTNTKWWEEIAIIITCLVGGVVTSWISVGVGEAIALLLFFLGFNTRLAVAIGVFTSSVSVLTGIIKHTLFSDNVSIEVLVFAGQAALVGGYLARHITAWLGGFYLKIFFSIWIFITGILMI